MAASLSAILNFFKASYLSYFKPYFNEGFNKLNFSSKSTILSHFIIECFPLRYLTDMFPTRKITDLYNDSSPNYQRIEAALGKGR